MLELILMVGFVGGGGYGLYKDYRNGFVVTGPFLYKISSGRINLNPTQQDKHLLIAETAVKNTEKNLQTLRESVAEIDANRKMAMKQSIEQAQLAKNFQTILDQIINDSTKREEAQVAAVAKVEAQKRSDLFHNLAMSQSSVLTGLEKELDSAEMELDVARTKASTIKVFVSITNSRKSLYALQSNVSQDGATPKGEIDNAIYEAEKEMIKSATLLDLANKRNGSRANLLLKSLDVDQELENARKRVALPPAQTEPEVLFSDNNEESEAADKVLEEEYGI